MNGGQVEIDSKRDNKKNMGGRKNEMERKDKQEE